MRDKVIYVLISLALTLMVYSAGQHSGYDAGFKDGYWVGFQGHQEEMRVSIVQKITYCESRGNHEGVWGDSGKSYGIAQFQKATFNMFKKMANRPEYNIKNRKDQLELLYWAIHNGYGGHWRHCYNYAVNSYMKEGI